MAVSFASRTISAVAELLVIITRASVAVVMHSVTSVSVCPVRPKTFESRPRNFIFGVKVHFQNI